MTAAHPVVVPEPAPESVEPRQCDWDDDPRGCARADDRYGGHLYDRDED
ncbi:hypothetical protein GTW43_24855 [Streptomyces sp. SID5785]|nr:hypothetical protein [Streptomyces sp. SID5785]MZD08285.1 hypothetical protein [Streptomyces sp. SID5785]